MLIGIDGNEANVINRVGVNRYAYEILWGLYKLQDSQKRRHRYLVYLKNPPLKDLPKENTFWQYKVISGSSFWIIVKLMPHLLFSKEKPDVLFSPSHYTVPFSLVPRVCSIMDLGYLNFSEQFKRFTFWQLKYWSAMSLYVSKHIIAISKATKEDIVRHYPFASGKVAVTHLAHDKKKFNLGISQKDVRRIKNKYSIVDDYVLFLSTLKPSKNIEGLLEAFKEIKTSFPKLKLVIAGKKGWLYDSVFKKAKSLKLDQAVIFTGFIEEKDKPAFIKGAKVLVAPSFWEGFGLQVLEAMACGTPVVVGRAGSLPETVGQAGVVVDPQDAFSIASGVKKVLRLDKNGYNKLVEVGVEQAAKFSWEKTARQTLKILEKSDRK